MKRALKKDKAITGNTQNPTDDSLIGQEKSVNPKVNRQLRTSAAMIGLAISMGASSLLITRQSDKAVAADPVGESSPSTTVATADAEAPVASSHSVKTEAAPSNSSPKTAAKVETKVETPVKVKDPVAAIRQASEFEASKRAQSREVAAATQQSTPKVVSVKSLSHNESPVAAPRSENVETAVTSNQEVGVAHSQTESATLPSPTPSVGEEVVGNVNAQLKEKQELALHELKAKSNRLKDSLAELRSEETEELSTPAANDAAPTTVVEPMPATVTVGESLQQPQPETTETQVSDAPSVEVTPAPVAVTPQLPKTPVTQPTPVAVATPQMLPTPVTQPTAVLAASTSVYKVKSGDTLVEIARNHGISVSDLVKENNISDPDRLQINQKISIPTAQTPNTSQPAVAANPPSAFGTQISSIPAPPVKTASLNPIVPAALRLSNSSKMAGTITVPTPIAFNNQAQTNSESLDSNFQATSPTEIITASKPVPAVTNTTAFSIGSTIPAKIETAGTKVAQATTIAQATTVAQAKPAANQYVQNLQAEIERLREKYRSQQANGANNNNINNVVVPVVSQTNKSSATPAVVSAPVTVPTTSVSGVIAQTEPVNPQFARSLANPAIQPQVAARPRTNEAINPEFVPGRTRSVVPNSQINRNMTRTRVATAPMGVDAFESLGNMRGVQVAPELPPLSPTENFLPNPSNPGQAPSAPMTGFIWPARGVLTSGYGPRWGRMHRGIDIAAPVGTPIYAAANGVVTRAGWNNGGYGKMVEIRHGDGTMTRYAHNSRILVREGQLVQQGQQITEMGSTGYSTGPHLHFEVHPGGRGAVNPMAFLPRSRS